MARQGNLFAVLDGEEDDEVSMLIESIAAKVEVSSRPSTAGKNGKKYPPPDSGNISLPLIFCFFLLLMLIRCF